jgi:hypothetical protein
MNWDDFYQALARRVRDAFIAATFSVMAVANVGAGYNFMAQVLDAETGEVLHQEVQHNLVTKAGLNLLKAAIATGSCAVPQYFAFGTSGTAPAPTDTTLGAEIASSRQINTGSTQDATDPTLTLQYYLSSTQCNGNTIREVGLFTATPSGGTMYARVVLASAIVKTISVAVAFTWTLTWGAV